MSLKTFTDPHLSLWQSAVDHVVSRHEGAGPHRPTLDHPAVAEAAEAAKKDAAQSAASAGLAEPLADAGGSLDTCADIALRLAKAKAEHRPEAEIQQLEDALAFSVCDPMWFEAVQEYVKFFEVDHGTVPYRPPVSVEDPAPIPLKANATVALIADWGTGTAEARAILERVAKHQPDVLIHLGDVYYSGTAKEMETYFLDMINEVFGRGPDRPMPVFNMTGNHDMYSGGGPFYDLIDKTNQPPLAQPGQLQGHSFFCLRSSRWQLLAMDTGLHDDDVFDVNTAMTYLEEPELAWHKHQIQNAGGRKTILLSHHQLFSAFSTIGPEKNNGDRSVNTNLQRQFGDVLGQVEAWLWGHEHNLEIYGPYLGLKRGRCIGASAVPIFLEQDPYKSRVGDSIPVLPVRLSATPDDDYAHCYVILKLDDASGTAKVSYYQDTDQGELLFEETLGQD
jgi:3',5'-cyclic AMP phosphodiesterase CpdA